MSKWLMGTETFPKLDILHGHCAMTVDFKDTSCLDAYNTIKDNMIYWSPEPKAGGAYSIWTALEIEMVWGVRTSAKKSKYDILFEIFANDVNDFTKKGCKIVSKSRTQDLSIPWGDTSNYCNMWNVLNEIEGPTGKSLVDQIEVTDCASKPKNPKVDCSKA